MARKSITWEEVRELVLALPGVEESTSYGTPARKVRGKLFARIHDEGEFLVVRMDEHERSRRMKADPAAFFITDHYRAAPWVLVNLDVVHRDDLAAVLLDAWRLQAPQRLLDKFESDA